MSTPFNNYISLLRKAKKKRRQLACVVTAMSVFVSGSVFWQLRGIGTAMSDTPPPGYDDSGGLAVPLSDAADFETPEIWEASLPPLTDSAGENLALIAESQLGYSESSTDFVHAEDGESHSGYTRYGAWYGNPYGDWNTMFTYFCLHYAGVKQEDIPYSSGCWAWSLELEKAGLISPVTQDTALRGDILLIDSDSDGKADRTAVIYSTEEDGSPGIYAIEGDVDGSVAQTLYPFDYEGFIGSVSLADIVPEPPIMNEAPPPPTELSFAADSGSGIHVDVSADIGAFPDDTVMTVFDISQEEAVQAAAEHFGEQEDISAVAVDITFTDPDGEELEPAEGTSVRVNITLPEEQALDGGSFSLLHVSDEGEVEAVENAVVSADGAQFEAESFSIYVLTRDLGYQLPTGLVMADGTVGHNSANNPYMIYVGESISVRYSGEFKDAGRFTVSGNDLADNKHHIDRNPYGPDRGDFNETDYRRAEFKGSVAGDCRIIFLKNADGNWNESNIADYLYVRVIDPIYVKTFYGEKGKDWIKEYLGGYGWIHDKNGYIQNTGGKPYLLRVGDTINVRSNAEGSFVLEAAASGYLEQVASEYPGYVTYKAIRPTRRLKSGSESEWEDYSVRLDHKNGDTVNDSMYIRVFSDGNLGFTHCDMEIADDGKYTLTEFTADGGKIEKVYKAYVTKINSDTILRDEHGDEISRMPQEAYKKLGIPEQTQYEMTSAYYTDRFSYEGDTSLLHFDEYDVYDYVDDQWVVWDPNVDHGNRKPFFDTQYHTAYHFDPNQVYSVDFDVEITLYPSEIITYDSHGNITDRSELTGEPEVLETNKVHFEKQAMQDAFNKCPLDNGLDFTYKPEGALVKLQAAKSLTNIGLSPKDGQFTFEIRRSTAQDEYKGKKISVDSTIAASTIFPGYTAQDNIRAYKLFNHNNGDAPYQYTDSFDMDGLYAEYPQYINDFGFVNLIDRIESGSLNPTDISESEYYQALLKYAKIEKAIYPDSNGNFDLEAGHYFFTKDNIECTASNDADGKVNFPYIAFTEQDKGKSFTYYIREISDPDDPDVEIYDTTVHSVTIAIDNDMGVTVTYDGDGKAPTFSNTLKEYTLPATGGTGTVPYILFGAAMISGALILLIMRRKKEVMR